MKRSHNNHPFHWIEGWNGHFYQRYDLSQIDFVLTLGHNGDPCPNAPTARELHKMVIGHTNGIHTCMLEFCHCAGRADNITQLLRARLWPAKADGNSRTVFTVPLLRLWHQLWLNSKTTTLDFMRCLSRLSDNAFPANVKVCTPSQWSSTLWLMTSQG